MVTNSHRNARPDQVALALTPISAGASLRDQAYLSLRHAIIEADIYGSRDEVRLDEKKVIEALGVSRTPVREAMTLLEQEGFLRTEPRRGVFILRKTKKEVVEMIHMWGALESVAARLATLRASDEQIAGLRPMFDHFSGAKPTDYIEEYSETNIAFHQALVELSGSEIILKAIENIILHVRAIRRMTIAQSERAARSIVDHMRIIEALEQRDSDLVETIVRQHSLDLARHVEAHCDFLG